MGSPQRRNQLVTCFAIYAALITVVFAHQVNGYGAVSSPNQLMLELHAESAEEPWGMGEELPYRYRPLFRSVVLSVYGLMEPGPEAFHRLFVAASALSLLLAVVAFHWLLRELTFDHRQAVAGCVLFLLGFPVFFSHDMPIHTREDLLGYAWIALTLIAVARDRWWAVALLGVVGASIRETCLLGVLPYFLVSAQPRWKQVLAYAIPGAAWLALRAIRSIPDTSYDYLGVSTAPTLEFPVEALLYLFACFGALWIAAGLRLRDPSPPRHPLLARRVVLLALLATAATGWTMGMVREARITYILFPFVIPLALDFLVSERGRRVLVARQGWAVASVIGFVGALTINYLGENPDVVGIAVPMPDGSEKIVPEGSLREVIGTSFQPGPAPVLEVAPGHTVAWAHASPLGGLHVVLHLAASAFLLVGAVVEKDEDR